MEETMKGHDSYTTPKLANNPAVGNVLGQTIVTETTSGAAYAAKVMHPPSASRVEYAGIPDRNNTSSVHPEYPVIKDISLSTLEVQGTTITANTVLIVSLPGMAYPNYVFQMNDQNSTSLGPVAPIASFAIRNEKFTAKSALQNLGCWRKSFSSTTHYLNATSFNNMGFVTCAQYKPNISVYSDGTLFINELKRTKQYDTYKSIVTAGDVIQVIHFGAGSAPQKLPGTIGPDNPQGGLPTTPGEIKQLSLKSTSWPAMKGAFVVRGPCSPVQDFVSLSNQPASVNDYSEPQGLQCWYSVIEPDGGSNAGQIRFHPLMNNSNDAIRDINWDPHFTCSMTLFSGLSVNTASGNPTIFTKSIEGMESQPMIGSMLLPFMQSCILEDETALKMVSNSRKLMADALPSDANDLGTVFATALKYAPTVIDWFISRFAKRKEEPKREPFVVVKSVKPAPSTISNTSDKLMAAKAKRERAKARKKSKTM